MTTVNIADLKNNLSKYLSKVQEGEEVLVKDRNIPIAKIIPLSFADDEDSELRVLVSEGKINLSNDDSPLGEDFFKAKLPRVAVDVAAMLREERDER